MQEKVDKIKQVVADYCLQNEGIAVQNTTDSAGNECLEWQSSLILEVLSEDDRESKKSLSRQSVSVQFDISFNIKDKKNHCLFTVGKD